MEEEAEMSAPMLGPLSHIVDKLHHAIETGHHSLLNDDQSVALMFCISCAQDYRHAIDINDNEGRLKYWNATRRIDDAMSVLFPDLYGG